MYLPHVCGRARAGSLFAPSVGRVLELVARGVAWGQVLVDWETDIGVRFAVYVDARLVAVTAETEVVIPSLVDGVHNISVVAIGDIKAPALVRPEWNEGDQSFLQWEPVDSADVAAYVVEGTEVATITIARETLASATGGGTGRLVVSGRFSGEAINADIVLTVLAGGRMGYAIGAFTGSVSIDTGETALLPYGAAITFSDAVADYAVGATYLVPLRIDNTVLTPTLARGTHEFEVVSRSRFGVESEGAAVEVFVPAPEVEMSLALEWDDVTGLTSVAWTAGGAHGTGLAVYSNVDVDGSLMEYVDEVTPTVVVMGASGVAELPTTLDSEGELRVRVAVITSWGYRVPVLSDERLVLPVPPVALGVPELLGVVQVGTALQVEVGYTYVVGDGATEIVVTRTGGVVESGALSVPGGEAGDSFGGSVLIDGADVHGTVVTLTAVATDGTDVGETSEPLVITIDLTQPAGPEDVTGVPA